MWEVGRGRQMSLDDCGEDLKGVTVLGVVLANKGLGGIRGNVSVTKV